MWSLLALTGIAAGSPLTLTQPELEALVETLIPYVEEAAGRRFRSPPTVRLATPEQLAAVLYREQVHLLGHLAQLSPAQADQAAMSTAGSVADAFVGKYGFLDKTLYVVSAGVLHALASRGIHPELAAPVIEVVLAHELAHALQDQHVDLGAVVSARPHGDAVMAVNCVVEGHAVYVHERVGAARGLTHAVDLVAHLHGYDRSSRRIDPDHFTTSYVYGRGRAFVAWHDDRHGQDHLWTLLTAPPASSAMILSPETYAPTAPPSGSPAARGALRRARSRIARTRAWGTRAWRLTEEPIGDFDLREQLTDRSRDGALADALRFGWRSRATRGAVTGRTPMLGIELQLLAFDHAGAAQAYVDRMRVHAEAQLAGLLPPVAGAVVGGLSGSVTPFDALDSDLAARESIALDVDGVRQELGTLWIARGSNVLQVVTVNHPVPDRAMARSLARVFTALE